MSDPIQEAIQTHARLLEEFRASVPIVQQIAERTIAALEAGGCVYLAGNGGSAADAQHIAAELVGRFRRERRALPAIALTTDTSNLTAIANDYGFDRVFDRQVEALVQHGDIVWLLSASGNSANIAAAARRARARGAVVVGFTGATGGALKPLCDLCLCVNVDTTDRIQEIHGLAYHILCDLIEAHFASRP